MTRYSEAQENVLPYRMKAVRVHQYGGLETMVYEDVPVPPLGAGQVLVRVKAAGVGHWDTLVRTGQSVLHQPLPLILGAEFSGIVEEVGPGVSEIYPGEKVFGVANPQFTGGYAEYTVAAASMIASKPTRLEFIEAASIPVVASTAWQMVFEQGRVDAGKRVLVQGGAGNVGAYAVQLAKWAGAEVIATALPPEVDYARSLGADQVIDVHSERFEEKVKGVDVVLDTVGGETLDRSFAVLKPGGSLISVVSEPSEEKAALHGIRAAFFIVAVTTEGLTRIADLFNKGQLVTQVGEVLPLAEARLAHEILAGKPHQPGKIVLTPKR